MVFLFSNDFCETRVDRLSEFLCVCLSFHKLCLWLNCVFSYLKCKHIECIHIDNETTCFTLYSTAHYVNCTICTGTNISHQWLHDNKNPSTVNVMFIFDAKFRLLYLTRKFEFFPPLYVKDTLCAINYYFYP